MTAKPPPLRPEAVDMLVSLQRHRLLSTTQLHRLHTPGRTERWTRHLLKDAGNHGLVTYVHHHGGDHQGALRLWFLTPKGQTVIASMVASQKVEGRRMPAVSLAEAAGPLQVHTLFVNEVGVLFVESCRALGYDCGPLDWTHNVAHRLITAHHRSQAVIADALVEFVVPMQRGARRERLLIEVDRATMTAGQLADKLIRYAALARGGSHGYAAFPPVLVILTGKSREVLVRRLETTLGLCLRRDADIQSGRIRISFCLFEDFAVRGPFELVFVPAGDHRHLANCLGEQSRPVPARPCGLRLEIVR